MTAPRHHRAPGWSSRLRHGRAGATPRVLRRAWVVVVLAVLLGFVSQSFVNQIHDHPPGFSATAGAAMAKAGAARSSSRSVPANPADTCPICREIAQFGHYLLPTAIAITVIAPGAHWLVAVELPAPAPPRPSHAWHSRAPPATPQA